MRQNLAKYLKNQPIFKILRVLCLTRQPLHLRQLVSICALSPAGVSHILKRLLKLNVLDAHKQANRIKYTLSLSSNELQFLEEFLLALDATFLQKRAKRFSEKAVSKFEWMDQTYSFFKKVKKSRHDST